MAAQSNPPSGDGGEKHTAGLFDIRFIIGALLVVYGVILLLTGLLSSDGNVDNSRPINIWSGVGLLVVGAFFAVWTKLRPTVVPAETDGKAGSSAH